MCILTQLYIDPQVIDDKKWEIRTCTWDPVKKSSEEDVNQVAKVILGKNISTNHHYSW